MKKLFLVSLFVFGMLDAAPSMQLEPSMIVNNCVLLKVNGKPITVFDVTRKMDMVFFQQYPELGDNDIARYQFYKSGWEVFLNNVIDDQLILADAKEKKITVSDGDVREELEATLGPDVVFNLEQMGLTLDEAFELVRTDLIVQRMNMMMVNSKALTAVQPKKVRERYEAMIAENPPQGSWYYQVLSVRGEAHEAIAEEAKRLLEDQGLPFEEVVAQLSENEVELSLSDQYVRRESEISLTHQVALESLSAGMSSAPITKGNVTRIFGLNRYEPGKPVTYNEAADKLERELTQELIAHHGELYRKKLRDHFGVTDHFLKESIPSTFEPFVLR